MPAIKFAEYQIQIDIDGFSNSWQGLFQRFFSDGVVLKIESPSGFFQWYYNRIRPWEHFIPVCGDLSDLMCKVDWVLANPKQAKEIAANGERFARDMSFLEEVSFLVERINGYSGSASVVGS